MPHQREEHGRVLERLAGSRPCIHRGRAVEQRTHITSLKHQRHESDRAHHGRPAADPIPHRETREPAMFRRVFIELRPGAGHGYGVVGELESAFSCKPPRFEHAVTRSVVPPDFEITTTSVCSSDVEAGQHAIHSLRISVYQKIQRNASSSVPSASLTNCGPQGDPPIPRATSVNRHSHALPDETLNGGIALRESRVVIPAVGARLGARTIVPTSGPPDSRSAPPSSSRNRRKRFLRERSICVRNHRRNASRMSSEKPSCGWRR